MKQKDLILIIVVVFISGVISVLVSKLFISPASKKETVETVEKISSDFNNPRQEYFNSTSLNPTKLIRIGGDNNQDPFQNN